MVRNAINSNGASEYAQKMYSVLTGKQTKRVKGIEINEQLVNPETGESLGDFRDKPGEGGAGKMPADVQTAEWMMRVNIAKDYDEAWEKMNNAVTNPAKFVTDYVAQELEVRKYNGLIPKDEGYRTTEQMRADAMEALKIIRGEQPEPKGPPPPRIIDAGLSLPKDGSAVQQEDGRYVGDIDRSPENRAARPETPAAGTVMDGYKFMGGNPADKTNWKRVTQ